MDIDDKVLDTLTLGAKKNPRLRLNYDMRNSPEDQSQRMLNALEPGTVFPVHRHPASSETLVVLRGAIRQNFYDDNGEQCIESVTVRAGGSCPILNVPRGRWHNTVCLESGTVIFETKDGPYAPVAPEDVK